MKARFGHDFATVQVQADLGARVARERSDDPPYFISNMPGPRAPMPAPDLDQLRGPQSGGDYGADALSTASNALNTVATPASNFGQAAQVGSKTAAGERIASALFGARKSVGPIAGPLGAATNVYGAAKGIYDVVTKKDALDKVQGGADAAASVAGFLGPYGSAFNVGYSAGQLLDQGANWIGQKITGNKQGDYSLSGMASDAMMGSQRGASAIKKVAYESQMDARSAKYKELMKDPENRKRSAEIWANIDKY